MKTRTKALLLVMSALLLIVSTVFATMAYLTSTAEVKNTFSVGNVTISMDEAKVNEYGVPVTGADRVTANTYKLIPGHKYDKDPIVTVKANSEKCYVFVRIENEIAAIESGTTIRSQITAYGWALLDGTTDVFYKTVDLSAVDQELPVFEYFTIKNDADVSAYNGKAINVKAYAIQFDGFDTNPTGAWTAVYTATP